MNRSLPSSSARAADDVCPTVPGRSKAAQIVAAAELIQPHLCRGRPVTADILRCGMDTVFGGSDASGVWLWRDAHEACEIAQVLFLRRYGAAMRRQATSPAAMLAMLDRVAALLPTQTKRSEESLRFQQFSTPVGLGFVAAFAAGLIDEDVVLEPSAGTGLLAIHVARSATLALNELAPQRADVLDRLFPSETVTRHDAAQIDDRLPAAVRPTVVLMNPPFSVAAGVEGRVRDAAFQHIRSAFARLADGGRLVAITGSSLDPHASSWRESCTRLQDQGRVVFSVPIAGQVYARHGTTIETRLTVIDKVPAEDPMVFPACPGVAPDAKTLLGWLIDRLPSRPTVAAGLAPPSAVPSRPTVRSVRHTGPLLSPTPATEQAAVELAYETIEWTAGDRGSLSEAIYEGYTLQSVRIPTAKPHPTLLVQSAAMASVAPPKPQYRPQLPAAVIADGLLSDAQLESVIYAGDAHAGQLDGSWLVDAAYDVVSVAPDDADSAVRFRRGWFLGDGTGAGKGRQVAGILLDNWLHGRRRAVWVSKSDKLLEDAQRDWSALGQERLLVTPQSRFRQGTPIRLDAGILFTTYATIRSQDREGKVSRVQQLVDWLGRDFDGVIVFDEAHAMANAGGGKGERGDQAASQQGRAGLRLQHALPDARILYVSATGATTVENLAYAQRLGLWGGADFPFATRAEFVAAIEEGGVAAMEVLARDLKALGLYAARSLSYEGIEYELVEHQLSEDQTRIYDAYAGAFQVSHNNLRAAMEASNIRSAKGTLNGQAMSAALSAFESSKQRFFGHLITAMKTPTLTAAIDRDLAAGHAAVIQIVSTGEALLERRLADIPTEEWTDIRVDVTPREYVLDYLQHSFPVQLFEPFTDENGNLSSRPVFENGQPVLCREAIARRDHMIEHLAGLDPVQSALDQIIHRFGTDVVAEVTGRSRRIVRRPGKDGVDRLVVENRPGSANLAETQAFMDDTKRILVFSDAGGTGRSYHAELSARNRRLRVHYLLEAGWKADTAIQGLGRTNRTNQAQPPLFRPVATDVKAEKRFLSTIARRLDTLGAITKGQRQTGGQGLFRADDNLESVYAKAALRQFFTHLYAGRIEGCTLPAFQQATGLSLTDGDGSIREDLPAITTFLNRLLALTIAMQNRLFAAFEEILVSRIEGAVASGHYDAGVETLRADSLTVLDRRTVHVHTASGAETVNRRSKLTPDRRAILTPLDVVSWSEAPGGAGQGCAAGRLAGRSGSVFEAPALVASLRQEGLDRRPFLICQIARIALRLLGDPGHPAPALGCPHLQRESHRTHHVKVVKPTLRTNYRTVTVNVVDRSAADERLRIFLQDLRGVGDATSLVFTATPRSAQTLMREIIGEGLRYDTKLGPELAKWIEANYHPAWPVAEGSQYGLAIHHGRLPRALGQLFVHLFNEGELTVLICTSTLIEGVNTAAANVFVYDKKINRTDFDFFSFANIRGRVGRMMRHFVGNAFLYHEPPGEIETSVDVPVLSAPDATTDYLIMNVLQAELSPAGRERQRLLPINTGLSPQILRDHGALGVDLLGTLNDRIRSMVDEAPVTLIWSGFPQLDQRIAVAELALIVAHRRHEPTGVHTPKQVSWAWSQLSALKGLPTFLRWFAATFSRKDEIEGLDAAFQFLQACEFGFPRTLVAIEALVREAMPTAEFSYAAYIASMECWFRPPWMKEIDEAGVPLPLAERLAPLVGTPAGGSQALQILRSVDLAGSSFDRIDRFIVGLALGPDSQ